MSRLQEALRSGAVTLESLTKDLAIKVKRHGLYPNLVQLKYHQLDSPMGNELVQEARGIILDEADNWKVIARPFDKFFNYGEGHAKPIDWASARVQEKLDGSLMIVYHYRDQWHVATSGTPDASGEVNGCGFTFAELFWRVWEEEGLNPPNENGGWGGWEHKTYMYELMTPYNRVVVHHKDNRIRLIGLRDRDTGEENPVGGDGEYDSINAQAGIAQEVKTFSLATIEDIEKTFEHIDPFDQEGYVVVDKHFNRVKVKSPAYVAIHHLRDGFGPKRILEIVRQNETTELLAHFPEWTKAFNEVKERYDALVQVLDYTYEKYKGCDTQKDFALAIQGVPMNGALFMLRAGKVGSVREYLAKINMNNLMDVLKIKDIEL